MGADESTRLIESTGKSSIVEVNPHNELYRAYWHFRHNPQGQPILPSRE